MEKAFDTKESRIGSFTVRIEHHYDYDADLSWLGSWSDRWTLDAIERRNPGRGGYRYFIPQITVDEHRRGLCRLGYSKHECWTLANQYVKEDMNRAETYGSAWYTFGIAVTVSLDGLELGHASLWGIESDSDPDYIAETEADLMAEAMAAVPGVATRLQTVSAAALDAIA